MATHIAPTVAPETQAGMMEPLYHVHGRIREVSEFGTQLAAVLPGAAPPPTCGVRFDLRFEGSISGSRLRGTIAGMNYVLIRADGRIDLHVRAAIATKDGARVSFCSEGLGTVYPRLGKVQLHENVTLHTSDERYQWVNALAIVTKGSIDLKTLEIDTDASSSG